MTSRHTITHADEVYIGNASYNGYSPDGRRGVKLSHMMAVEFGAVDTLDADGICVDATATEAKALSMSGALVASSVGTLDVARGVSITSTSNNSGVTFTVTGTDEYGETLVEDVTGPNATTVYGAKAFKTVTSVASDGAVTGNVDVGSSKVLGLPVRIADKGDVVSVSADGVPESTLTVVAGMAAAGTSTSTTADVRGTVTPDTAPNGTIAFTALVAVGDNNTKGAAFGTTQYGG